MNKDLWIWVFGFAPKCVRFLPPNSTAFITCAGLGSIKGNLENTGFQCVQLCNKWVEMLLETSFSQ